MKSEKKLLPSEFLQTRLRTYVHIYPEEGRGCRTTQELQQRCKRQAQKQVLNFGESKEGMDPCLGTVRDSACGELLNCFVIESDRLLTT